MINWLLSIKQSIIRLILVGSGYSSSRWCNRIRYLFPDLAADGQISMINTWCLGEAPRLMTGLTVQAIDKIWNMDARDIILHTVYLRKISCYKYVQSCFLDSCLACYFSTMTEDLSLKGWFCMLYCDRKSYS